MAHAILSPSAAKRWASCVASPFEEKGTPDMETGFAQAGTRAHRIAELTLREVWLKHKLTTEEHNERERLFAEAKAEADDVQSNLAMYFDAVMGVHEHMDSAQFSDFRVELPLEVSEVTTEPGARGTADCVVVADDELWIIDLKYGAGVPVEAVKNYQLAIYALAAMNLYAEFGADIEKVHLMIVQPRCGGVRTWDTTASVLRQFEAALRQRATRAMAIYREDVKAEQADYEANAEVCRFCKAKLKCPAYTAMVKEGLKADYEVVGPDGTDASAPAPTVPAPVKAELDAIPVPTSAAALAKAHAYVPLIEQWCKEVSSAVASRLSAGEAIPGLKLVEGRRGARKWADAKLAEETMKRMRLKQDQMYDWTLISPTSAEKLIKSGVIGQRQAKAIREMYVQADGKPVVAPESDPRPALPVAAASDFEVLPD